MLPQPAPPSRRMGVSGIFAVPDPSPSLDPLALAAPGQRFDTLELAREQAKAECYRDTVRRSVFDALAIAKQQCAVAAHAARSHHADATIGEAERNRRAHSASVTAIQPAVLPLETARAKLSKAIGELRKIVEAPAVELLDIRGVEIRTKIAGLKPSDRFAAISRAISRGDDTIAAAVLGVDRILSDFLSDVELETLRASWALARFPNEVARLKVLEADLDHCERASVLMQSFQRSCANQAIVEGSVIPGIHPGGTTYGAAGPTPIDRSRSRPFPVIYG